MIIGSQAFRKACMTFVTQANSYFFHFQHEQRNVDFARKRLDFSETVCGHQIRGREMLKIPFTNSPKCFGQLEFVLSYTFKRRQKFLQTVFLSSLTGAVSGSFDEVNFSPYFLAQFGVRVRRAKIRGPKYNKSVVILCWRPPVAANKASK